MGLFEETESLSLGLSQLLLINLIVNDFLDQVPILVVEVNGDVVVEQRREEVMSKLVYLSQSYHRVHHFHLVLHIAYFAREHSYVLL